MPEHAALIAALIVERPRCQDRQRGSAAPQRRRPLPRVRRDRPPAS